MQPADDTARPDREARRAARRAARSRHDPGRHRARSSREERRTELLDAATGAVRQIGANASMQQLAAAAGVTKPILYRHFGDRDGLVAALAQRFAAELTAELESAFATGSDPRQTLIAGIDAYVAFIERDTELYRFVVQRLGGDHALAGFMQSIGQRVAQVIGEQLRAVGRDSGGAEAMAHGIVGMVHAAGHWWVEHPTMPRERLVEYLADMLWGGLGTLTS